MSTLTTRVGGFRYVIRDAVSTDFVSDNPVRKQSARALWEQFGHTAKVGRFYADGNDDIYALPYELRTTSMQYQGQLGGIMASAEYGVQQLFRRLSDHVQSVSFGNGHAYDEECELCEQHSTIAAHLYGRSPVIRVRNTYFAILSVLTNLHKRLRDCDCVNGGMLLCDRCKIDADLEAQHQISLSRLY